MLFAGHANQQVACLLCCAHAAQPSPAQPSHTLPAPQKYSNLISLPDTHSPLPPSCFWLLALAWLEPYTPISKSKRPLHKNNLKKKKKKAQLLALRPKCYLTLRSFLSLNDPQNSKMILIFFGGENCQVDMLKINHNYLRLHTL